MKSHYKRLGDYIREVNVRNRDLAVTRLVGLSIDKIFITSVANTIGTDMSNYKIIRKGQFACSLMQVSRDEKIPIAMLRDDEAIMSPAYPMFEVIDTAILLPEYLMMWFSRSEFDREASFYAVGGVRGSLTWEDFCNLTLPIPAIEVQREIVSEYASLSRRISLNESICDKLEQAAAALYRKSFIDNIDPQNLPHGWRMGTISDVVDIIDGDRGSNYPNGNDFQDSGYCLFLNAGNVTRNGFNFDNSLFINKLKDKQLRKGKLRRGDIVFTTRGTVGNFAFYSNHILYENMRINSGMVILRAKVSTDDIMIFVYDLISTTEFKKQIENYLSGSAQPQLPIKDMNSIPVLIPTEEHAKKHSLISGKIRDSIDVFTNEVSILSNLQTLLLSKLATN